MTLEILPYSQHYIPRVLEPPPDDDNIPLPVNREEITGWEPTEIDMPLIVLGDISMEDRMFWFQRLINFAVRTINAIARKTILPRTTLPQTNMTRPFRVYDPKRGRVSPYSQITVPLDQYDFSWWNWLKDMIGERNAINFKANGDGNMDGASEWGLTVMAYGTNLFNGIGEVSQSGSKWILIQTLDFDSPPKKIDGVWYYQGTPLTPDTHPHLFVRRVNRVESRNVVTWQTSTGINYANDKGEIGGKGSEAWAVATKGEIAALRLSDTYIYPKTPFEDTVYKNSLVVDGDLVPQTGGKTVTVVDYIFTGTKTFIVTDDDECYLWEEMLVRGSLEDRSAFGTALDWRVYGKKRLEGGRRSCRTPDVGWLRPFLSSLDA